jgi:hypothetical protein
MMSSLVHSKHSLSSFLPFHLLLSSLKNIVWFPGAIFCCMHPESLR